MQYDEQILLKAAARIEKQADEVIFQTAAKYTVVTGIVTYLGSVAVRFYAMHDLAVAWIVIGASVAAVAAGISVGRQRAFDLLVQLQQILVLIEIERNVHQSSLSAK